jgi:hypothetical protein
MEKKVLSKREFANSIQTTIQLSNKNKSKIQTDEVKQIVDRFQRGGSKIIVRGLNVERWMTLKGLNEDFDAETFLDYYKNKVSEDAVEKFTEFFQLQISVIKERE